MSRNLELLQRVEQQRAAEIQADSSVMPPLSSNPVVPCEDNTASAFAGCSNPIQETIPSTSRLERLTDLSRDQLVKLVQRLFIVGEGTKKCVVFSGAERGTGCTWVAAHVAQLLAAQTAKSVCIVDANLDGPGMDHFFSIANHYGLSDAVLASAPIDQFLSRVTENLWLLSCGSSDNARTTLFHVDRLRARITELRSSFEYVIVDAPPFASTSGAAAVASASDGVVLVLKANASRRESAQTALQEINGSNTRFLGVILNQRTFPVPQKIYKYL